MRIPPLHRDPVWQRFFSGLVIGGCISWTLFLILFGMAQEQNAMLIQEQANQIKKLRKDIEIWQEDYQKLNQKNEEMLTVQEINITLVGYEKYQITDRQSIYMVEEGIKDDLRSLLAKDLATVHQNKEIIKKTIENKIVNINDKKYKLSVREIFFYTTIEIELEPKLAD